MHDFKFKESITKTAPTLKSDLNVCNKITLYFQNSKHDFKSGLRPVMPKQKSCKMHISYLFLAFDFLLRQTKTVDTLIMHITSNATAPIMTYNNQFAIDFGIVLTAENKLHYVIKENLK